MWSPTWVGDRLRAEGRISPVQLSSAIQNMKLHDERIEEALLRVGAIDEDGLLKFVAEKTKTGYVPTAKLAELQVREAALRAVPESTARKLLSFPVKYDEQTGTLSLVSPDAGNPEHVKQIGIATGIKNLRVYFARPAAVNALIKKWYHGEIQSFAEIAPDTFTQIQASLDMYERQMLQEDGLHAKHEAPPSDSRVQVAKPEYFLTPVPMGGIAEAPPASDRGEARRTGPAPDSAAKPPKRDQQAQPTDAAERPQRSITAPMVIMPEAPEPPAYQEPRVVGGIDRRLVDLAEMLNVLVALNENARDEFRGHSASTARLGRSIAQRMGMDELAQIQLSLAGNLHDVGKPVAYHLTALNVAQYATHRTAAEKLAQTPVRLLESVALPAGSTAAVAAMYERWDGQGFPGRLAGKSIPLGARILSLCDTYSDLTQNPRNPYRRVLSYREALAVLDKLKGTLFDPDLVALLSHLVAGEDLKKKLSDNVAQVLLVEPNLEEATVLELRLVAQGFEVVVARTAKEALSIIEVGGIGYVLAEVELTPFDGFELLSRVRRNEATHELPFFFVARASDTASIDRGFALGAQDYVVKPTSGDVLAGKLRRLSAPPRSRRDVSAGVAGSLSEMSLTDLAQILGQGRKSGRLTLQSGGQTGEVHFQDGRIVHAILGGLGGDSAFYELLGFEQGSFSLDPAFQPTMTTIQGSAESLILEGLRRLDERNKHVG